MPEIMKKVVKLEGEADAIYKIILKHNGLQQERKSCVSLDRLRTE